MHARRLWKWISKLIQLASTWTYSVFRIYFIGRRRDGAGNRLEGPRTCKQTLICFLVIGLADRARWQPTQEAKDM